MEIRREKYAGNPKRINVAGPRVIVIDSDPEEARLPRGLGANATQIGVAQV